MNGYISNDVLLIVGIFATSCAVLFGIFKLVQLIRKSIGIKKEINLILESYERLLNAIGISVEFALRIDDTIVTLLYTDRYNKYVIDRGLAEKFIMIRNQSDEYRAFLNGIISEIVDAKVNISDVDNETYEAVIFESWKIISSIARRLQDKNAGIMLYARDLRDSVTNLANDYDDEFLNTLKMRFNGI